LSGRDIRPVVPVGGDTGGDTGGDLGGAMVSDRSDVPAAEPAVEGGRRLRAERSEETRKRVLDVVVGQLEAGGEVAVRIDAVRDRSGVSIGSIYHHFGDRDGLIMGAQLYRFARYAEAEIAALSEIVERAKDIEEFRRAIRQLTLRTASEIRSAERWARIGVLGSTIGRPGLAEEVRLIQTRLTDEFERYVVKGQVRGFFRGDLDARAIAVFVEAYSLGHALNDLDANRVSEPAWEKVVWAAIDALLTDR
jgi:AcrR family transcriptional regulator